MVYRPNLVIAVFNGLKSGTKNTVDYKKKKGIRVIMYWIAFKIDSEAERPRLLKGVQENKETTKHY